MKFKDLLPAEDNFNFGIDVLAKIFLQKLKTPFTSKSLFLVLCGAKGFGKTYLICLLALFYVCNFEDYNVILSKYTFKAARTSYSQTLSKVINDLSKHGVTIANAIENKQIRTHDSENRCDFVWPNKRMINIVGFDNTSNWEGVPAAVGEWGMFAIDEVIPIKDTVNDEEAYIYQLINMLIQIVRGQNLTTSFQKFDELSFEDWWLYKKHFVIFGFNNHDVNHIIYQLFVTSIIPLNEERKLLLEQNSMIFDEDPNYLNVGATVIRGTTAINKHNLNPKLLEFGEGIKDKFPEHYETLFMGGEHEGSLETYSYRKDLIQNAQFFNPQDFFWDKEQRFWFDEISIGCDYADGQDYGDDAVTILLGFEFKGEIIDSVYVLDEYSISTKKFKDMTKKVNSICNNIFEISKKYISTSDRIPVEQKTKFKIGQDSRTVKDFIKLILENDYGYKKHNLESFTIFKSTGKNGWSVVDRHYMWKRLLSEKKLFFSNNLTVYQNINGEDILIKSNGYLYDQLFRCKNNPDTNIRNEKPKKNKLDAINAAEHALSFFRYRLFGF